MNKKDYQFGMLTLFMLAVLSVSFSSCGKDGDSSGSAPYSGGEGEKVERMSPLIGTWKNTVSSDMEYCIEFYEDGTGVYIKDKYIEIHNTTPESYDIQKFFRMMVEDGCDTCVMEVSSQALKLDRTYGIEFDYGIFTNLAPDHIGENEHKDYAEYRQYILDNCGITLPETQPGTADSDKSHGIVAGGSVYISGHDVNLNGLVQSGYASYTATLDSDSLNKIEALDNTYAATVLTDATVLSDSQFAVVNAGSHYDEYTDQYVYTPGIYYNPSTKKLIVDSITTNPGQVVITGNVISTGDGRVFAADGAAEISINTAASDRDVQVNNLSVSSGRYGVLFLLNVIP